MRKSIRCFAVVTIVFLVTMIFAGPVLAQDVKFDSDTISGLGARNIGSAAMSGRVAAIAAVKEDGRLTVYLGAASGGVWKSSNGGTTFKPVFDKESAQSIGAVAIDPQAPKTIWAGTGEAWTRNSVSIGTGIYKSTDGGDSWTNMGLQNSSASRKSSSIRKTATRFTHACREDCGATARIAAFTKRLTAGRAGTRF